MKQKVKCADCGRERVINRRKNTHPCYSFWCDVCRKEVAQDRDFRKQQDVPITP